MTSDNNNNHPRHRLITYLRKENKLISAGFVVGLVLALGIWLVALDDLGVRLATIGAFIAAILTPVLASIVNNFIRHNDDSARQLAEDQHRKRGFSVIAISAILSLIVVILTIWLVPRLIATAQTFMYHRFDTEDIRPSDIMLKNNLNMRDGSTAVAALPTTRHHNLKLTFGLTNNKSTTLCTNAATLKVSGAEAGSKTIPADSERHISLGKLNDRAPELKVQLVFLPETDPTCVLDVYIKSATYYK